MSNKENKILVIGGDKRYDSLADMFVKNGTDTVRVRSPEQLKAISCSAFDAVLPYPLSPDGVSVMFSDGGMSVTRLFATLSEMGVKNIYAGAVKEGVRETAEKLGLNIIDYGRDEALLQKNALCSAEGAIHILMRELDKTIHGSNFVAIGYGRIGRILSCRLKALGAKVSGVARRAESRALMELDEVTPFDFKAMPKAFENADAVINTVPYTVLSETILKKLPKDTFVLDLASSPGGVDRTAADLLGVKVIWALSIPGKYCPESAAGIIYQSINNARTELGGM